MPLQLSSLRTSSLGFKLRAIGLALSVAVSTPAALIIAVGPAAAEDKPACDQFNWSLKREQALFAAGDLRTVASGATLDAPPGGGVALELKPNASVAFILPPERQPKTAESSGGIVTLSAIAKPGAYQVTASAEAWIDVIQNGKAVASTAHTGRRDCADVRKSVRFDLQAGAITIQVSGADTTLIKLAVLPVE